MEGARLVFAVLLVTLERWGGLGDLRGRGWDRNAVLRYLHTLQWLQTTGVVNRACFFFFLSF